MVGPTSLLFTTWHVEDFKAERKFRIHLAPNVLNPCSEMAEAYAEAIFRGSKWPFLHTVRLRHTMNNFMRSEQEQFYEDFISSPV